MSDSGFASLGPTLLARKGGAKPAMRPQLPVLSDAAEVAKLADEQLEDLGWNDMGEDGAERAGEGAQDDRVVVPIDRDALFDAQAAAASPIVRRQQRRLEERVLADAVMTGPEETPEDDAPVFGDAEYSAHDYEDHAGYAAEDALFDESGTEGEGSEEVQISGEIAIAALPAAPKAQPAAARTRRAAFTLRLDPERHLKLRLAATMKGISAQALVTEALDAMLAEFDELDVIAAHLQRH